MRSLTRRPRLGGWMLVPAALLIGLVVPALAYTLVGSFVPGVLILLQYVVATAYTLTALMTLLEARAAKGSRDEPIVASLDEPQQLAELPTLTAVVSAYLPNEQELVAETIVHLATQLRVAPGSLQIVLAYNTPEDIPDVESVLSSLAELNVAFTPLRVPGSHSKAENIAAALPLIEGDVTVLLDADHRPRRDAAARALRWFDAGYDIVQGRCVIRDYGDSALAKIVAVEFEQIYAVAHAGRSLAFDTAMFCGTNGWWRTSVLREIGMNHQMLTEDIDSSVRALLAGHRIVHDRSIVSTELAPPTAKAWWGQRLRWAQGWFQVTLRHQGALLRSPRLTTEMKLYWTYLLGWRELFPLLSLQIFALLAADALLARPFSWFFDPYLVLTTMLTLVAGPLGAISAYGVALESRRRELRYWFVVYAAASIVYTTVKNTVAIVAMVRELLGQRSWIVTSRSSAGVRPQIATTAVLALLTLGLLSGNASAAETARLPLAPLTSAMTLTGRTPVSTVSVALPHDWRTASGTLRLRWQASPQVTPNSSLSVRVDGALLAARGVRPGADGIDVRLAAHRIVDHRLRIEIAGQLHTRLDAACCIPDAAGAAIIQLSPASRLTLRGTRAARPPLLADLPGSLVDTLGASAAPLQIVLPPHPSGNAVRAAALLAGAVSRAAGGSVPVKVHFGAGRETLDSLPGQVVEVLSGGRPRVSVRRRPDGRLIVSMTGRRDGVVRVAWALARAKPRFIPGAAATITSGLPAGPAAAVPTQAKITPAAIQGTGRLEANAVFRLPESRELTTGKAHLRLDAGYAAPAGGRIDVTLNGLPLMSRILPRQGTSRLRYAIDLVADPVDAIDHRVALGLLAPGDNLLTIRADLPAGQPVGGAGDAQVPQVSVLPSSVVTFTSRPRSTPASLALWPWPYTDTPAMTGTAFVLPAAPTPDELSWVIKTIAEASRWSGAPAAPQVRIAPPSLPDGDLVVLTRGARPPVALPDGAPGSARLGVLATYRSGGRQLLIAHGVRALRPLSRGYRVGAVRGAAAIVRRDGTAVTLAPAPRASSFEQRPRAWKVPAAIIVAALALLLAIRVRSVRRRLDELPPPPPPPADDPDMRAQLAEWERLVAHEDNGRATRDDIARPS